MKGLGKILMGFVLVTVTFLFYVGERVEILRVSYRMNDATHRLAEQSEALRRLRFEVTELRSPRLLEKRLEELPLNLTLPRQIQVLKISAGEPLPVSPATPLPPPNFFDFFGEWIQTAQARTEE